MPELSPLLRSSFEVLEHSLWHYFRSDTSTDRKFALLHLDQGIELILKERVRRFGVSVNKKGGRRETISIWEAYEILEAKGCPVPEKADLEMLHQDRNDIQHRYSNPTAETAVFHMGNGIRFLKRFTRAELELEIEDYLSKDYIQQVLGT